jgi:hypothetical protein
MKPLSKKIRVGVLWVLFFLFVVLTPILIGYSNGYRIDDALGLIQTGGIYIHSDISNTSVFLNDDFVENNGAFLKNTFIQDLLPNRYYSIRAEKEGHQSWVKVLAVKPNHVTEARVLMLPSKFEWVVIPASTTIAVQDTELETNVESTLTDDVSLTEEVDNPEFLALTEYFSEDRDQFEVEVATTTYEYVRGKRRATTTTVLEVRFPEWLSESASTSILLEKEMVREREGIVTWLDNGDLFAIWNRTKDPKPFFFCEEKCKEQLVIDWGEPILRYDFYPNRNDLVVVLSERGLYVVELDNRSQRNIQTILEEPNLDFRFQYDGTLIVFNGKEYQKTIW